MSPYLRSTAFSLGLVLAALIAFMHPAPAIADEIEPFLGTYVGTAQVLGSNGEVAEERDMDITISEERGGGFSITWINVTRVDGRRDVPGVRRRVDEVMMEPGERDGVFLEKTQRSLFERRRDVDVLDGDAMRWARIEGNSLGLFSLVVMEDGGYELQSYERILTEDGLAIEFSRVKNGVVTRRIVGRTIRVD